MKAHYRCRAHFTDRTHDSSPHGIRLGQRRNDTEKSLSREHCRYSKGKGIFRNILDLSETAVIDLLLTALLIKVDHLYRFRIIEIRNMRIIEGDMTILSDTHEYDIDRVLFQDLRIFLNLLLRISLRTYIFYAGERQLVEDGTS